MKSAAEGADQGKPTHRTRMVWMSFRFWETNANHLLSGDLKHFDPDTMTPSFKACAVRIEKIA